jgi:hypothetical protein
MSTHRFAITLKNASQVEPERRDRIDHTSGCRPRVLREGLASSLDPYPQRTKKSEPISLCNHQIIPALVPDQREVSHE